jgi:hypothetical protein
VASRTPRIAATLNNLALGSGTIITASSQETSLPVAFLRDPLPTRKWRSKLGWNVVAGYNDKLDFTEAAVARVATITAGNYATGAAYATAVQTAMNAAPGHVNTYTVTYDPATKAFTITRSAGAAALVLTFQTGANEVLNKGAHRDLGFTDTDLSGVTQTGSAAYHSREWVRFDFGSAQAATVGIVHAHNMGTTGTANLYFKTADSQAWTSAAGFSRPHGRRSEREADRVLRKPKLPLRRPRARRYRQHGRLFRVRRPVRGDVLATRPRLPAGGQPGRGAALRRRPRRPGRRLPAAEGVAEGSPLDL